MQFLVKKLVREFGKPYSRVLGIDLDSKRPEEVFKWFLASILFGKRIGENTAIKTYREFERYKLLTPGKIQEAGWDKLVEVLDSGGYVRYDFSTATKLLEITKLLEKTSLENIYKSSRDSKDLENNLQEIKGIGPVTTNIFLRELRVVWPKSDTKISPLTELAARNLGIGLKKFNRKTKDFIKLEVALLRLGKNFCRKNKCEICQYKGRCRKWEKTKRQSA